MSSDDAVKLALDMSFTGRGGAQRGVACNAVFMYESRGTGTQPAFQVYTPLADLDVPHVMTESKGKSSYVKVAPCKPVAMHFSKFYSEGIKVFGNKGANMASGQMVNLQGLFYEVSKNETTGEKRVNVMVGDVTPISVPYSSKWLPQESGMRMPVEQQRVFNHRRRQLIDILIPTDEVERLMKPVEEGGVGLAALLGELDHDWARQAEVGGLDPLLAQVEACLAWNSPNLAISLQIDQSFSALADDAATRLAQGDVGVIHADVRGLTWTYVPVRNKQECPLEMCMQGARKDDEKKLPGFKVEVSHWDAAENKVLKLFFDTKVYQPDLAPLGLCLTGKKQTFSLSTLAAYESNILAHLTGTFLGRRYLKDTDGMQQKYNAAPDVVGDAYFTKSVFLGEFAVDIAAFARRAGMNIPSEHMLTFVTTLLGGTKLTVNEDMRRFKQAAPRTFDLAYARATNIAFIEGDVTPLILSPDVDMFLVVAGTEPGELAAKLKANAEDFGDKGLGLFLEKLEAVPFAIFVVAKPGCTMSLDAIMHLGAKRARLAQTEAA